MRILFFSDNFPPEVNACANRTYEHCREWVDQGHDVTVITSVPNFPQGRVHDGFRNRWRRQIEMVDGIRVVRVWTWIAPNEGTIKRIVDQMSYLFSSSLASLREKRPDVIVGTSPQFFAACAAYAASVVHRRPWIFELRDIWPESIRAVGALGDSKLLDLMEKLELFLYRKADHIVSVTRSFREELGKRGIETSKISVTTNGVDLARFARRERDPRLASRLGLEGKLVVGYIGTIGMAHGLEIVPRTAAILRERGYGDRVAFLVTGDGAERKQVRALSENIAEGMVVFVDPVPREEVADYWALSDAALVHLRDKPLFETVIPSKIFEAMAMRCPILHGVRGESADIVTGSGAGLAFTPENPEALADVIISLVEHPERLHEMAHAGGLAAPQFSRTAMAHSMEDQLQKLLPSN